jgi:tetratricopeptide (TPR) repeat protein
MSVTSRLVRCFVLIVAIALPGALQLSFAQRAVAQSALAAVERSCLSENDPGLIDACSKLINAGVGNLAAYHSARGSALLNKRDCDGALADFDAAIKLNPRESDYYGGRGLVFYQCKRDFAQAVAAFTEVIRLTPRDAAAYDIRANAKKYLGDLDGSIADDTMAIRLAPKLGLYYGNRGISYSEKGDAARALADFNRDAQIEPTFAAVFNNRGQFFLQRKDPDKAIPDLNEAIRLNPRYSQAYANRSDAWRLKGDLDRSLADTDQAIALSPNDPLNYSMRADTLRYRGDYAQALAEYDRALALMADYIPAFTGRGLTYERMGDIAAARREFAKALASHSDLAHLDYSKSSLETARARVAALDSGAPVPVILPAPKRAASETSIPTPAIAAPVAVRTTSASQGRRIALVIGNSAYKNVQQLDNPKNDAAIVGTSLRNIGFDDVRILTDATCDNLREALRKFADDARNADWALVYYAGHGVELNGVDYLVPIDAKLTSERELAAQSIPLADVTAAIAGARKLKLVLIDACRDNPFEDAQQASKASSPAVASAGPDAPSRSLSPSLGRERGLAEIKTGSDTLVFFAAKQGERALDGDGNDSPFAVAVVQRLATPGVEINKLFRLVRDDVMEATAGRQEPHVYGSLPEQANFYFVADK